MAKPSMAGITGSAMRISGTGLADFKKAVKQPLSLRRSRGEFPALQGGFVNFALDRVVVDIEDIEGTFGLSGEGGRVGAGDVRESTEVAGMRRWPPAVSQAWRGADSTICWTVPGNSEKPPRLAGSQVAIVRLAIPKTEMFPDCT